MQKIGHLLRSRAFWFVLERIIGNGAGFVLMAVLARVANVESLALFIGTYAFASVFQPLFNVGVSAYVVRLINEAENDDAVGLIVRSAYALMQGAAILVYLILVGLDALLTTSHLLSALILLQIVYAPMALFVTPYRAKDRYRFFMPISVAALLLTAILRIGVLLATHDLFLTATLLGTAPVVSGLVYALAFKQTLRVRPFVSLSVMRAIGREIPSLFGAMFLTALFWRTPVLIAQAALAPIDVVRVGLSMQLVTGLSMLPSALCESLFGPLALAWKDDRKFKRLLRIGSGVTFLSAAIMLAGVAFFGDRILLFVFGAKAQGAAPLALMLSTLCVFAGLERLINTVVNLRGRPYERIVGWGWTLGVQLIVLALMSIHADARLIAIGTPLAMFAGTVIAPYFLPALAPYARDLTLGFADMFRRPPFLRDMARAIFRS